MTGTSFLFLIGAVLEIATLVEQNASTPLFMISAAVPERNRRPSGLVLLLPGATRHIGAKLLVIHEPHARNNAPSK